MTDSPPTITEPPNIKSPNEHSDSSKNTSRNKRVKNITGNTRGFFAGSILGMLLFYILQIADIVSKLEYTLDKMDIISCIIFYEPDISYDKSFEEWKKNNTDFLSENGLPGGEIVEIDVLWYQFFQNGVIFYNATHGWSDILNFGSGRFTRVDNPITLISQHHQPKGHNRLLFDKLIPSHVQKEIQEIYWNMIETEEIIGGIGTLYVKHGLYSLLGKPEIAEKPYHGSAYLDAPTYRLLLNVSNRATDNIETDPNRSVVVLHNDGRFKRYLTRVERPKCGTWLYIEEAAGPAFAPPTTFP